MANEGIPNQDRTGEQVSRWNEGEAERYAKIGHGVDGEVFLDPHLRQALSSGQLKDKKVLDIGSGTGPWSKWAVECEAKTVVAVDINEAMLRKAKEGIIEKVRKELNMLRGSAEKLPIASAEVEPGNGFDVLMSINVGCNLGSKAFAEHFKEAARVAKPGSRCIVTAPISLLEVFTTGEEVIDVQQRVDEAWTNRGEKTSKQMIAEIGEDVMRATFVLDQNGKPILVSTDKGTGDLVKVGQPVLRKIPGKLCVENNYHTPEEYFTSALEAGWEVEIAFTDTFVTEAVRTNYNKAKGINLGKTYTHHPPFLVLELKKPLQK